ncbi:MAG: type II toxin-antitoxin system VapC family toxin [Gemmataceae bacterium]
MSRFLLDTDHLTLYQMGHPRVVKQVATHLTDELAIAVITAEEQLTGWQSALRLARDDFRRAQVYGRMALALESLAGWKVFPFSLAAMNRHASLVRQRLNVASNDLKIAATALEENAIVVTRNRRDFSRVPTLILDDWSQ